MTELMSVGNLELFGLYLYAGRTIVPYMKTSSSVHYLWVSGTKVRSDWFWIHNSLNFNRVLSLDNQWLSSLPDWAKERVHVVTPPMVMEVGRRYELWYGSTEKGDGCRSNCHYITLETCFLRDDGSRVWMARQAHANTLFDSQGKEVYCDGHRKPYYLKPAQ